MALFVGIALVVGWHLGRARLRVALIAVALLVPIAVAYSRLYRGMHHPSDIVASFVNGALAVTIWARHLLFGVVPDAWGRLLDGSRHNEVERTLDAPSGARA